LGEQQPSSHSIGLYFVIRRYRIPLQKELFELDFIRNAADFAIADNKQIVDPQWRYWNDLHRVPWITQ
jgi:hypothetical protein